MRAYAKNPYLYHDFLQQVMAILVFQGREEGFKDVGIKITQLKKLGISDPSEMSEQQGQFLMEPDPGFIKKKKTINNVDVIQLKAISQFQEPVVSYGIATCPVHAVRNVVILLQALKQNYKNLADLADVNRAVSMLDFSKSAM